MSPYLTRLVIAGCWLTLALTIFFVSGVLSVQSGVILITAGVGPPLVMLGLWQDTPLTLARIMRHQGKRS